MRFSMIFFFMILLFASSLGLEICLDIFSVTGSFLYKVDNKAGWYSQYKQI